MAILASNIQRFSLQDGPGIRTTVFLMGCSLHCPWCANPENISRRQKAFVVASKCKADAGACPFSSSCAALDQSRSISLEDVGDCPIGAIRVYGQEYSSEELLSVLLDDLPYYAEGGGVTWSGGEPLLQAREIEGVMAKLNRLGVDQCAETCLFAPADLIDIALSHLNRIIIDVKTLDDETCRSALGGNLDLYLSNLDTVFGAGIPVTLRFPIVPGITDDNVNIGMVRALIDEFSPANVELFSVHNLAESKYASMHKPFHRFEPIGAERLSEIRDFLARNGANVSVIKL
ncbi:MAG: glycyl-radical enzyme activating protein [Eggerthellaceae bacterium]|nr:glycyl-radical enzyme activating protein [Eggerthellaceae bacterium]